MSKLFGQILGSRIPAGAAAPAPAQPRRPLTMNEELAALEAEDAAPSPAPAQAQAQAHAAAEQEGNLNARLRRMYDNLPEEDEEEENPEHAEIMEGAREPMAYAQQVQNRLSQPWWLKRKGRRATRKGRRATRKGRRLHKRKSRKQRNYGTRRRS